MHGIEFQECSINPSGGGQNYAWIGVDPYCSPYPNFLEKRKYGVGKTLEMEEAEEEAAPEIETLPLFPMHGDIKDDFNGWYRRVDDTFAAGSRASLELTLNSYAAGFPSS